MEVVLHFENSGLRLETSGSDLTSRPMTHASCSSTPTNVCNTTLQIITEHQTVGVLQEPYIGSYSYFIAREPKMWQDDEDNNPYGSFNNQDPANPALSASCEEFAPLGRNLY